MIWFIYWLLLWRLIWGRSWNIMITAFWLTLEARSGRSEIIMCMCRVWKSWRKSLYNWLEKCWRRGKICWLCRVPPNPNTTKDPFIKESKKVSFTKVPRDANITAALELQFIISVNIKNVVKNVDKYWYEFVYLYTSIHITINYAVCSAIQLYCFHSLCMLLWHFRW